MHALLAQCGLDAGLKAFQARKFGIDFIFLCGQFPLLFRQIAYDLFVGGIDVAGIAQKTGFLAGFGFFQEQGNRIGLAVFIVPRYKTGNLRAHTGNFSFQTA